jgi:hypothetical protein
MSRKITVNERMNLTAKLWGVTQPQMAPVLGVADGTAVSKRLGGAASQINTEAELFAKLLKFVLLNAVDPFNKAGEINLRSAILGTDLEFFAFLASSDGSTGNNKQGGSFEFDLLGASEATLKNRLGDVFPLIMGGGDRDKAPDLNKAASGAQSLYFLYRLGISPKAHENCKGFVKPNFVERDDGLKFKSPAGGTARSKLPNLALVVKRVPARFVFRKDRDYRLEYEEYFVEYDGARPFAAKAWAYAFSNFLTIISRDTSGKTSTRPALMHLDSRRALDLVDNFHITGVTAMESDVWTKPNDISPTAYRVLLRPVPQTIITELDISKQKETALGAGVDLSDDDARWAALKEMSRTAPLKDTNTDGIIDLSDSAGWSDEPDVKYNGAATPWVEYFKRLNTIRCPIDIELAQYANFHDGKMSPRARWYVNGGPAQSHLGLSVSPKPSDKSAPAAAKSSKRS